MSLYTDALCNSNLDGDHEACVEIEGWEVLPTLHEIAEDLIDSLESNLSNVHALQVDMRRADVRDSDVVVLTSLCWDKALREQIAYKLAKDLPKHAIVVDYQEDTFLSLIHI